MGWSCWTLEDIQRKYRLLLQLNYIIVHSKYFPNSDCRVVTWYMGSGLKAQNLTGIRAQRKELRLRRMGSGITRLLSPNQGSDLLPGLKISYHNIFPHNHKVCVHRISWPRYITYSCFRQAVFPVIRSHGCLTKTRYHILNLLLNC